MTDLAIRHKPPEFTAEQIDLIKNEVCTGAKGQGATDNELKLFMNQCRRTGLDPFFRQIYAIWRWKKAANGHVMDVQISIDGFRLIAERTGEYEGQTTPEWCGHDGVWREVWLSDKPPAAARVGVLRKGFRAPLYGVARFASYKPDSDHMWQRMPDVMVAKCAEMLAFRKAFPQEFSGLYGTEEMQQAEEPKPLFKGDDPKDDPWNGTPQVGEMLEAVKDLAKSKGMTDARFTLLCARTLGPTTHVNDASIDQLTLLRDAIEKA